VPGTGAAGYAEVKGKTPKNKTSTTTPKTRIIKSFLLLFFKKEALPYFLLPRAGIYPSCR
jgi:hypothetical protein